ncbi:hypothetical protein CRM22_007747 [Opisthorchis felineus]|uniref:Uncharacterized protein n=1 Tax=Opisthorchis felineus TaxID=147828 RepID=A0A4S2LEC4_OPIFE|nr:hypothetical protein CRM22_007747 [Opisthorchis felineus]
MPLNTDRRRCSCSNMARITTHPKQCCVAAFSNTIFPRVSGTHNETLSLKRQNRKSSTTMNEKINVQDLLRTQGDRHVDTARVDKLIRQLGIGTGTEGFEWHDCQPWLRIQNTLVNVILCKDNYNITETMQDIRSLVGSNLESHIPAYCEKKVFPITMRILRKPLQGLQGVELLKKLGEVWRTFFTFTIPTISLMFALLPTAHHIFEAILLQAFLTEIVEKLNAVEVIVQSEKTDVWIEHMYSVLLTFCNENGPTEIGSKSPSIFELRGTYAAFRENECVHRF